MKNPSISIYRCQCVVIVRGVHVARCSHSALALPCLCRVKAEPHCSTHAAAGGVGATRQHMPSPALSDHGSLARCGSPW
jgi:hypothetical protein